MSGMIGNAKIITFRTDRYDSAYAMPLNAIASGISTGHVALLLTFSDQEIFNKYIANNAQIPHSIKIDPHTKKEYYEVYVSFWPQKEAGLYSDDSVLHTYELDTETSATHSPFIYADHLFAHAQQEPSTMSEITEEQLADLITPLSLELNELRRVKELLAKSQQKTRLSVTPIEKMVKPRVPILQDYAKSKITLGPVMMVHTTRLQAAFGPEIMPALETYVQYYTEWRKSEVQALNYKQELGATHPFTKQYQQHAQAFKRQTQKAEMNLNVQMFPEQSLSHEEFMQKLEPFVTIGAPERDSISIPIVHNFTSSDNKGLALEPMLQYICDIANKPDVYQYHVLGLNCAAVTYNTLWEGAKDSPDPQLKQYLALSWYVNLMNLTLTPTMLIQNAAKAEQAINDVQDLGRRILRFSDPKQEEVQTQGCSKVLTDLYSSVASLMRQ